jgi:hypothetical protein
MAKTTKEAEAEEEQRRMTEEEPPPRPPRYEKTQDIIKRLVAEKRKELAEIEDRRRKMLEERDLMGLPKPNPEQAREIFLKALEPNQLKKERERERLARIRDEFEKRMERYATQPVPPRPPPEPESEPFYKPSKQLKKPTLPLTPEQIKRSEVAKKGREKRLERERLEKAGLSMCFH